MEPVEICTRVIESFDANAKLMIGTILSILLNIIMLIRVYLSTRQTN